MTKTKLAPFYLGHGVELKCQISRKQPEMQFSNNRC